MRTKEINFEMETETEVIPQHQGIRYDLMAADLKNVVGKVFNWVKRTFLKTHITIKTITIVLFLIAATEITTAVIMLILNKSGIK